MRYEHIELDISTATCAELLSMVDRADPVGEGWIPRVKDEIKNLQNELRARLQRRDVDPHCPKNAPAAEDWLNT